MFFFSNIFTEPCTDISTKPSRRNGEQFSKQCVPKEQNSEGDWALDRQELVWILPPFSPLSFVLSWVIPKNGAISLYNTNETGVDPRLPVENKHWTLKYLNNSITGD